MRTSAILAITCLATPAARADAMADTLCPILEQVASGAADTLPEAAQARLVMAVAAAYDYDPDALQAVLDGSDAATEAACPEARSGALAATRKASLADAMR
jgi:hypothetical protein